MAASSWHPAASMQALSARAVLLARLREFFKQRDLLEVDVPLLSATAVTDIHIESIPASLMLGPELKDFFLSTSPEYFMKRLLAAGSGSIYYLGKAFRQEERGSKHHHEFTLLEWYREGWDEFQLMAEVTALLAEVLPGQLVRQVSYQVIFEEVFNCNPHRLNLSKARTLVKQLVEIDDAQLTFSESLDVLFTHGIEPRLTGITFIYDFPVCQAALARLANNKEGDGVARRFEVYVDDLELANGYFELTNADEQEQRFQQDLSFRQKNGMPLYPMDRQLLAALEAGLPSCAGVALGVDRLLMKILNQSKLESVLTFP